MVMDMSNTATTTRPKAFRPKFVRTGDMNEVHFTTTVDGEFVSTVTMISSPYHPDREWWTGTDRHGVTHTVKGNRLDLAWVLVNA